MPESIVLQTVASVSLNLSSGSHQSLPSTASNPSTPDSSDSDKVMQTYVLDRFGVSDEFYHELTQVCFNSPATIKLFILYDYVQYCICSSMISFQRATRSR